MIRKQKKSFWVLMGQNKMYDKSHELTWQPKRPINPSLCHSYEFLCNIHSSRRAANLMFATTDTSSYQIHLARQSKLLSLSKCSRCSAGLGQSIRRSSMDANFIIIFFLSLSRRQGQWSLRALKSSAARRWRTFWAGLGSQSRVDSYGSRLALVTLHPPVHTRTWVKQD